MFDGANLRKLKTSNFIFVKCYWLEMTELQIIDDVMFSVTGSRQHFFLQKNLSRCTYCAVSFSTHEEVV